MHHLLTRKTTTTKIKEYFYRATLKFSFIIERNRVREREGGREIKIERERERESEGERRVRLTDRHIGRQPGRQIGKQPGSQADRQTGRQADIMSNTRQCRNTNKNKKEKFR